MCQIKVLVFKLILFAAFEETFFIDFQNLCGEKSGFEDYGNLIFEK